MPGGSKITTKCIHVVVVCQFTPLWPVVTYKTYDAVEILA